VTVATAPTSRPAPVHDHDTAAGPAHVAPRAADALVADAWTMHHQVLFGTVVRCTRDEEVAADIVADTFEALLREARLGRAPDNVPGWLHRVARNRVVDWSRRRARWAGHGLEPEGIADDPETALLRHEAALELRLALARLPEAGRRAVVLEGRGYRPAEIAPILGRTGQATRTLLCRAHRRVAAELRGDAA
jgi:RNA polymerase sigma factor (sigma-70 family)